MICNMFVWYGFIEIKDYIRVIIDLFRMIRKERIALSWQGYAKTSKLGISRHR